MCQRNNCHWLKHLLGKCDHYSKVDRLQKQITHTRKMTNKELRSFNRQLNLIIKDDNIKITLSNIKKVSQ